MTLIQETSDGVAPCSRKAVLSTLAAFIAGKQIGRPLRVAVDGRTASGKTTLSNELELLLKKTVNREIIRTSIDGFHKPKMERYARGRYSAEGYYYDSRDFSAIRQLLLNPLGSDGDRQFCTAAFDLEGDRPLHPRTQIASHDAILIVDGTFLQRPELLDGWDLAIFVRASQQRSEERGVQRDKSALGGMEAARKLYATRYQPAFDLYETLCAPESIAGVVFDNDDLERPSMIIRDNPRDKLGVR